MKYSYLLPALVLLLSGCLKNNNIEFDGITPGIKSGVFIVKTMGDSTIYGENIKDGKFATTPKLLKTPDYYMMNITDDNNNDNHEPFEIYLEGGKYTIGTIEGQLYKYPKITSSSKIQQQLSAFYTLSDSMSSAAIQTINLLKLQVKDKGNGLSPEAYTELLNKLTDAENKMAANNVNAFREFVKENPNSTIAPHLMTRLNYEDDPKSYNDIYTTLSPAAKATDEGKEIGEKLNKLMKLLPGKKAPAIAGNTADGKPFDPKSITKKYILIDFWRASNQFSRQNHAKLTDLISYGEGKKDLAIVSVSLDTKRDWWITAIDQDNMKWTQVSDLKGDDSPNATSWNITTIPTYYLLDNNWNIVKSNIDFGRVDSEVSYYFVKHK